MKRGLTTPPLLNDGDTIALLSPASAVDPELIDGAAKALSAAGFAPLIMPHAKGQIGSFSGTSRERLTDLQSAIDDPKVKAIICSRGGYGAVHLLPQLRLDRPVWLAGFSDISALHAFWHANGQRSIHSSMAKELALRRCEGDEANRRLMSILRSGVMPTIEFSGHSFNNCGDVRGQILGGNLAVLQALIDTPYDLLGLPGSILVIEDIAEPIYKVERILWQLRMNGALERVAGIIVGQFTSYRPSVDHSDMYSMISPALEGLPCPIAFGAPFGHVDGNLPFIEGEDVMLHVDAQSCTILSIL